MDVFVNGTRYTNWDQVPPEVRQQLAATLPDADRNGIPDLLEGNLSGLPTGATTATSISVDGQQVASMAALPPEVQALMRQAFGWPTAPPAASPATSAPASPPGSPPASPPADQVLMNGVPTSTSDAVAGERKSWWRRLFG